MNRKDFLTKLTITTVAVQGISNLSSCHTSSKKESEGLILPDKIEENDLALISDALNKQFKELLLWINQAGWAVYIEKSTGADTKVLTIATPDNRGHISFTKIIDNLSLKTAGFDDFAGKRLIEPGYPAMSLLYHALASARVQPAGFTEDQYPSIEQLDLLENYIYAVKKITAEQEAAIAKDYVLAVFAYEYRPAFKTPHHIHADMVFSRTGVARIGDRPMNYSKKFRCHLNLPVIDPNTTNKQVAVTPARYGLFLSKLTEIKKDDMKLMGNEAEDDGKRFFLQPIRKIFNDDLLINNQPVKFDEYHKAEKLYRLAIDPRIKMPEYLFDVSKPPFVRTSYDANKIVKLTPKGSSALLNSTPGELIRPAKQEVNFLLRPGFTEAQRLYFEVPKANESNRYFSSFSLINRIEDADVYLLGGENGSLSSSSNRKERKFAYKGPKNSPQFVNMRYVDTADSKRYDFHLGPEMENFEYTMLTSHWAGLFEDSICDGCIAATITSEAAGKLPANMIRNCLPAFSLVTAPDFFPQIDSFDLSKYDIGREEQINSHFFEGGTASLCTLRKRVNPTTVIPHTTKSAFPFVKGKINPHDKRSMTHDTITSVMSCIAYKKSKIASKFNDPKQKDYISNSFLPDAASSVFNPGWDTTYSNDTDNEWDENIFLTTRGLGSPFPEDMKLCAAANGMWPVASPDIARSYQGTSSVEDVDPEKGRYVANPTSIPLMDIELGFHENSPAFRGVNALTGKFIGWDGEQGPFLEKIEDKVFVNFTDIGRADFVDNALHGLLDMSLLRDKSCAELISRMECLRICLKQIDKNNIVASSALWLVSAEEVEDWKNGAKGRGIPPEMFGNKEWATKAQEKIEGKGFLYVFINAKRDYKGEEDWVDSIERKGKRRRQLCEDIFVCQVTEDAVSWCEVVRSKPKSAEKIRWKQKLHP
jgi:hypothetical protein